jgi:transposase
MTKTLHSGNSMVMALELSNKKWKLAFSNGEKVRHVSVDWGDKEALLMQVELSKKKLMLSKDVEVYSCYESGRDGFWIDRFLRKNGIKNLVVDPASIEVSRRKRRAKTDRLDAEKLALMLIRYCWHSERTLWRVVRVPDEGSEDERRLHRNRQRLLKERNAHTARIRSLLVMHGIKISGSLHKCDISGLRDWEAKELAYELRKELEQELARLKLVIEQMKTLEDVQKERLKVPNTQADEKAAKLLKLKGVGQISSWILGKEFFGWRHFKNRREVGALAGLTGTPYSSGDENRDLGISKAGNKRVRSTCVELAWCWLRFQPESELSKWYMERFGSAGGRMKRIGIVALARKLLVALWKYVEKDEIPQGAIVIA